MDDLNFDADAAVDSALGGPAANKTSLQNSIATALPINPDRYADMQKTAALTGQSVNTVQAHPELMQTQAKLSQLNLDQYQTNSPQAASFLSNPEYAKIGHDDTDNLAQTEKAFGTLTAVTGPAPGLFSVLGGLGRELGTGFYKTGLGIEAQIGDALGFDTKFLVRKSQQADFRQQLANPTFESSTAQGVYSALAGLVESAPELGGAIALRSPALGAALFGGQAEAEAYTKYRGRDASPLTSFLAATGEGGVTATTQMLPMGFLVHNLGGPIPAKKMLMGMLGTNLAAGEAQTVANDAIDTAVANPDKTWGDYWAERPEAAYQGALGALVTTGVFGGIHLATARALHGPAENTDNVAQAQQNFATFTAMNDLATASKVKARNGEAFNDFIKTMADNGSVKDVYIDQNALQQSGIPPEELAKLSPSTAEQLQNQGNGGTVKIPVEEFVSNVMGSDIAGKLLEHLKTDPNGFSQAEAKDYMATQGDNLKSEIEKTLQQKQGDETFKTSRDAVHQNILDQLQGVNRFTKDVNDPYASLVANFYSTMAARTGVMPEELFHQHPLYIKGSTTEGASLAQPLLQPPISPGGMVTLDHFSKKEGLTSTNPGFWGSNPDILTRDERNRIGSAPGRTYFGVATGEPGGYIREQGLGPFRYKAQVPASGLYDMANDPKNLKAELRGRLPEAQWNSPDARSLYEKAIKDAGYKGYWINTQRSGLVAALFHDTAITPHESNATVNIGMHTPDGSGVTEAQIEKALKEIGVKVREKSIQQSMTEPTYTAHLNRALTPMEGDRLSRLLRQEAVAQYADNQGQLYGPSADKWGPFNPDYFLLPNGQTGTEAGLNKSFFQSSAPVFTSTLQRFAEITKQAKAPADQWLSMIKNATGVKAEEIKWTGLEDWLKQQTGPVTKEQLSEYLATNDLHPQEVMLGAQDDEPSIPALGDITFPDANDFAQDDPSDEDIASEQEYFKERFFEDNGDDATAFAEKEGVGKTNTNSLHAAQFVTENEDGTYSWDETAIERDTYNQAADSAAQNRPHEAQVEVNGDYYTLKIDREAGQWYVEGPDGEIAAKHFSGRFQNGVTAATDALTDHLLEQGLVRDGESETETKFADYSLPGGENYRELLLTLPDIKGDYRSSHFGDTPNVVAHVRFKDRVGPNGEKILGLEEIQSDWHQSGRKYGYREPGQEDSLHDLQEKFAQSDEVYRKLYIEARDHYFEELSSGALKYSELPEEVQHKFETNYPGRSDEDILGNISAQKTLAKGLATNTPKVKELEIASREAEAKYEAAKNQVPDAPFKTSWAELAFKRMVRYAAEGGYEKITWTTGEQQVERYARALRQQVDHIKWEKTPEGIHLLGELQGHEKVNTKFQETELSDAIGKSMAEKIISDPNPSGEITGSDITIDSTGMAGFYDKILPQLAAKFGKKFGAKVEDTTIDTEDGAVGVHGMDITPEMRDSVMQGQPLFQNTNGIRGSFTPDTGTLALLANSDLTSFLHESGHFFLDVMSKIAARPDAPAELRGDFNKVMNWFGVKDAATWQGMSLEQQRDFHEKFARGFEAYLFEGKSPNLEMKGIFQRFRAWMLNVYKHMTALNVPLNDEVRGVFDRLLATNEQIQEAETARNAFPLFTTPAEAGMTNDQFKSYHDLGVEATADAIDDLQTRTMRDMKWLSNAKDAKIKELQAEANRARATVRREVNNEVRAEPIYAAEQYIRTGKINATDIAFDQRAHMTGLTEGKTKLGADALREVYGENSTIEQELRSRGLVSEQGIHPDVMAELFGFSSGDELVKKLVTAEPMAEKISGLIDQRMLERHGDLTDPQSIANAANEALSNQARTRFVSTEMNALNKLAGKPKIYLPVAKTYAEQMVNRTRIRDIRPFQYSTAEAKQAKEANRLRRAGNIEGAAAAKRNQLIQNLAGKAALEARDNVAKALKYFSKFQSEALRKKIDPEVFNQITSLLNRFELSPNTTLKSIDQMKSLRDWLDKQAEIGLEPDVPADLLNDAYKQSYKDMSIEQFKGLYDTVKQIEHLGRLKQTLLTAAKDAGFATAKNTIVESILKHAPKAQLDVRTRTNNIGVQLKDAGNRFLALHRKMASVARQFDGHEDGGPMWEHFIRNMNKAGDNETTMRSEATKKLAKIADPIMKGEKLGGKGTFFESIGKSLNREERISIALNMGNEGNMQRLLDGEGWKREQLEPVLKTLTKEDWDFAQHVWDYFESFRPDIAAKEKRVYGREPNWIDPTVVSTPHGDYRGGYYPIKYDPKRSGIAAQHADAEDAKAMMKGAYTSATTRRSFTKDRAASIKGRPLVYNFSGLYTGANDIIHDLSWHEWLIDTNRLLRSKSIDQAIRNRYGAEWVGIFKDGIKDIARGDTPALDAWEQGLNYLRHGATISGLGWNFTTSLLQPIGLTNSMVRIGPGWVAKGIGQWLKSPFDITDQIYAKSPMMASRGQTMMREIAEVRNRLEGKGKIRDVVEASMFYTIQKMQLVADIPTFLGQYEKSFAAHGDEAKAVAEAEQAVTDAQGGGTIKDLAGIQRGGPLRKLFTTFYSYFNVLHNLTAETHNRTDYKNPAQVALAARDYLLLYVAPVVLADIMKNALFGAPGSLNPQQMAPQLIGDQIDYLMGTMVGVREISPIIKRTVGVAPPSGSYAGPAGLRFMSALDSLGTQISQGEFDDALRKAAVNTAGIAFHLPSAQLNRSISGLEYMLDQGSTNPIPLIGGPPPRQN